MASNKRFAYRVVESTYPRVKVGEVLLYTRSRGPTHSEQIFNVKTFKESGSFYMERIGPCWVVGGKVQFEKPPAPRGEYTAEVMSGTRKKVTGSRT